MSCSNFNPDMPSTSASNATVHDSNSGDNEQGKKSVTVLISDTGEITYDEETLQSIIGNLYIFDTRSNATFSSIYTIISCQISVLMKLALCIFRRF